MTQPISQLDRRLKPVVLRPEKIVQFGTGAFLKGFFNAIVQTLNHAHILDHGIVAVKLRAGNQQQIEQINRQDGLFTLNVRGYGDGLLVDRCTLIDAQTRALSPYENFAEFMALAENPEWQWVVSNTTEAGIRFEPGDKGSEQPPQSFPAKLTLLLHKRFQHFNGDPSKGLRIFCCELIEDNATTLRSYIHDFASLWGYGEDFKHWLDNHCRFHNTLVDRIVTGKPNDARCRELQESLGYLDAELVETECYFQWVIETDKTDLELQRLFCSNSELNIILTDDLTGYRQRKVRILNGAHTGCVAIAALLQKQNVYQAMQDVKITRFLNALIYKEVVPTIAQPEAEVMQYADAILERFQNPFLDHAWQSIALNSVSKWRARLLPTLQDYVAQCGQCPTAIAGSLAALLLFYIGESNALLIQPKDDPQVLVAIRTAWHNATAVQGFVTVALANEQLWGDDLNAIPGLNFEVARAFTQIQSNGVAAYLDQF